MADTAHTDERRCQTDDRRCGCHRRHAEAADRDGRTVRLLEPAAPHMVGR